MFMLAKRVSLRYQLLRVRVSFINLSFYFFRFNGNGESRERERCRISKRGIFYDRV